MLLVNFIAFVYYISPVCKLGTMSYMNIDNEQLDGLDLLYFLV